MFSLVMGSQTSMKMSIKVRGISSYKYFIPCIVFGVVGACIDYRPVGTVLDEK